MTKLEQAARKALEALELDVGCPNSVAEKAITALREALAEQAEQEPVGETLPLPDGTLSDSMFTVTSDRKFPTGEFVKLYAAQQPVQQEPVALPCCGYHDASSIMWNKFNGVVQCHNCGQIYAAHVQQVDLTDDEIANIIGWALDEFYLADIRAVIAADREKNK